MLFNSRKEKIDFLKNLATGKKSIEEITNSDKVECFMHDTGNGSFVLTDSEEPLYPAGERGIPQGPVAKGLLYAKKRIVFE